MRISVLIELIIINHFINNINKVLVYQWFMHLFKVILDRKFMIIAINMNHNYHLY